MVSSLSRTFSFRSIPEVLIRFFFLLDFLHRKEVIHPHVLVGMPCYDFTPVIDPTLIGPLLKGQATDFRYYRLPWRDGRCVQHPGTYSPRHSDSGLLAIPTSWSRVADSNPNWDRLLEFCFTSPYCFSLYRPLQHACSPRRKRHDDLTSSSPSSSLHWQYLKSAQLNVSNLRRGLRSLLDLTKHLTTRADDNHAPSVTRITSAIFLQFCRGCQIQVRFFAYRRIKQHAPPLVRVPVNSFEFQPCDRTTQAEYLMC